MKKVVFIDLGGVVCGFHRERRLAAIAGACKLTPEEVEARLWHSGFDEACDQGNFSLDEICNQIRRITGSELSNQSLSELWASAFEPDPAILQMVSRSGENIRPVLFSDNSPLVEAGLRAVRPEISGCFDRMLFSHHFGGPKRKPSTLRLALDLFDCRAQDAILIDDNASIVSVAQGVGMTGVHYAGSHKLELVHKALGVLEEPVSD